MFEGLVYKGKTYRAESNLLIKPKTVQDIIDFEIDELGNSDMTDIYRLSWLFDFSKIPAKNAVWVCNKKEYAEHYGNNVEIYPLEPDNIILHCIDNMDFLILENASLFKRPLKKQIKLLEKKNE